MPFTQRPLESPEDREKRLTDLSDAFVLWASESGLIDLHVNDDGEMYFTKAVCEDCGFDDDAAFEEDESFDLAEALTVSRPLPHIGKHRPARRVGRIPLAALPVAAGVMVATTAAYASTASHNEPKVAEVTAAPKPKPQPVKSAPVHHVSTPVAPAWAKTPYRTMAATPVPPPTTGDAFAVAIKETPKIDAMWAAAANSTMKPKGHSREARAHHPKHPLVVPVKGVVKVPATVAAPAKVDVKVIVKVTSPKPKKHNPSKKPTLPPVVALPPVTTPPVEVPPVTAPPVEVPPVVPPIDAVVSPVLPS